MPHDGRLILVRFEELRTDPHSTLKRVLKFIGTEATDAAIARALSDNALSQMREKEDRGLGSRDSRPDVKFVGSGGIEDWRETLNPLAAGMIQSAFDANMVRLGYPPD